MGSSPSSTERRRGNGEKRNKSYKIVLVGDPGSGKSNVFLRYCRNQFDFQYRATTSLSIGTAVRVMPESEDYVGLQLWDLPGQESKELRRRYYRDADAAIVVVDCSDSGSIDSAIGWCSDVTGDVLGSRWNGAAGGGAGSSQPSLPVLLMGTKHDLLDTDAEMSTEDERRQQELLAKFEAVGDQAGFIGRVLVSAKSGDNSVYSSVNFLLRYLWSPDKTLDAQQLPQTTGERTDAELDVADAPRREARDPLQASGLQLTGRSELDPKLQALVAHVEAINGISKQWQKGRKQFARACRVLPGSNDAVFSTVEQGCLLIKKALQQKSLQLYIADDGYGFLKLSAEEADVSPQAAVSLAISSYDGQVCPVARKILRTCPNASLQLTSEMAELEQAHGDLQAQRRQRKLAAICKQNSSVLEEAVSLAGLLVKDVEGTLDRISARLSW